LELMAYNNTHPFKARPFTATRALQPAQKHVKRNLTKPIPFHLGGHRRVSCSDQENFEGQSTTEAARLFRARPMPNFATPVATVNTRNASAATVPSPFRRSSDRTRKRASDAKSEDSTALTADDARPFKAQPVPKSTYEPQRLRSPGGSTTTPASTAVPFKLESDRRHEIYQAKFKAKLTDQEAAEKLQRQFRARVFTCPPPPTQTVKSNKEATTPVPFHLVSLERHEKFTTEMNQKMAEEEEALRRLSNFKANPVPNSTYESPISPSHQQKVDEERLRRQAVQDEERRRQSMFKAKPVPKSTYEYQAISSKPTLPGDGKPQTP
jgi:hypothetical protein